MPGVFSPVRLDDRLLVDGGMANNLPISVVREMGADIVIAVDISTPLLTEEQLTSVLSVTEQLSGFLTRRNTEAQIATLDQQDILIIPELGEFSSGDFEEAVEIVHLGYEATMNSEAQLSSLADENLSALTPIGEQQTPEHVIDFIDVYYASWHWPTFNIADSAIVVGAALLLLDAFTGHKKDQPAA